MKKFAKLNPQVIKLSKGTFVQKVLALTEEYGAENFFLPLEHLYAQVEELAATSSTPCRKCGNCCLQAKRELHLYAIEAAYLGKGANFDKIPGAEKIEVSCFLDLNEDKPRCILYHRRPMGCRLFLPCEVWNPSTGCADFPHSAQSSLFIRSLLSQVAFLNEKFIFHLGLHRDFDFDYQGHWGIAQWFQPLSSV